MKLYEGRIAGDADPLMDRINRSLPFDIRLLPQDVATNRAWAGELMANGVFTQAEHTVVIQALDGILAAYHRGDFDPLPGDEDVHTLVERLLTESLGPTGARIHTGRSRNDQVACDMRLYVREFLDELASAVKELVATVAERARAEAHTLLAGTTHMQPALPVTLGQFLCSLGFASVRDHGRLLDARARVDLCPLGSGAMAGSAFPVNRRKLAEDLGFAGIMDNSIDAVSDRDFCQEVASACAMLTGHLSRYAEQFIIWANPAFGYIRFNDTWSTGSSMMPQKRNPDAMELVRGKAARVHGSLTTLLSMTKGVPLTYAKDLQEDKEALFDALDTTLLVVQVFTRALASASFFKDRMLSVLTDDMLATDLADALARVGVPFRTAHERVAGLVSRLESQSRGLLDVSPEELKCEFPEFGDSPPKLDFQASVAARTVEGGTAPESVLDQVTKLEAFK